MHRALWTLLVFSGCRSWLCPEDGDGLDYCDPAACAEGTHAVDSGCADDQEPRVTYPNDDSGTDSGADSGTDSGSDSGADSASDSGADDSQPPPCDLDGDGFESTACGGADCDDEDAGVHPAAPDLWDQVDNNCDGLTDRTTLDTVSWASTSGSAADDRLTSIDNLCGGQDLTGDGVPDLAVGAPVHGSWDGAVLVLDGAQVGAWTGDAFADARLVVYGGGTTDNLGFLPDRFGDLNGDGVPDLLVGARAAPGGGAAYVFFGGAGLSGSASSASADRIITPGAGGASTGFAVESASDLDGDGAVDLLVADPAAGVGGVVALFRGLPGAATVSMDDADALLRGGAGERFGETTTGGDLDGDGYDDLLAGIPGSGGGDGGLVVVRGAATLPSGDAGAAQALRVLGSGGGQMAGNSRGVARPADLDASGRPDLAVSVYQALGAVLVFVDPDGGTLTAADATVRLEEPGQTLGSSLVSGDLDSDGVPDLLVGAYQDSSVHASGGAVYALWGGPHLSAGASLDRTTADAVLDATGPEQLLGTAVGFTGDLSGDGVPDWLVGASWDSTGAALGGTLHVLAGVP